MRLFLRSRTQAMGLGLAAIALALRLPGLGWALPDVFEEATPLRQAWEMWGFGPMLDFDLNPHFFRYPSLVIYLHLVAQALLYVALLVARGISSPLDFQALYHVDPTAFLLVGRGLNVLFGVGTVVVLFRLGQRVAGAGVGVTAAALLAVNTTHIAQCQMVDVDVPLTFLVVWALERAVRCHERPSARRAAVAGMLVGLAASAKYTGAVLAVPLLAALVPWRRLLHRSLAAPGTGVGSSWKLAVVALLSMAAAFCVTSPFVLLDARAFWADFSAERQHMELGHFGLTATPTIPFYLRALGQRLLGAPLAWAALAGLAWLGLFRRRGWVLLLAAFLVPYAASVGSWNMKADRYLLPLLPLAALLAAALLAEGVRAARLRRAGRGLEALVWVGAASALAVPTVAPWPEHVAGQHRHTRSQARAWIEQHVPAGAFVLTEWQGPELLSPALVFSLEPAVADRVLQSSRRPVYAVQKLPVFQVSPARSTPFYDLDLYPMADVIVTSEAIRSRYETDPTQFEAQRAFYDSVETRFRRVAEFAGGPGARGPRITIYRSAAVGAVFGQREGVPMPRPLRGAAESFAAGEGAHFFYEMGQNYEEYSFGYGALRAYELAEALPMEARVGLLPAVTGAHARCLTAMGKREDALRVLERAERTARNPADREQIRRYRRSFDAAGGGARGGG